MKLVRVQYRNRVRLGLLDGSTVRFLSETYGPEMKSLFGKTPSKLIRSGVRFSLDDVKILPPLAIPAHDIICIGLNYYAHREESESYFKGMSEAPVFFSKRVNRLLGDGDVINGHFDIVERLDYEAELAVIIGKPCYQVSEEEAEEYVFGYSIFNDFTARNLQKKHTQWFYGKSLDDFCPMGPLIVTKDEFEFPPKLAIRSYVNGELRQDSDTGQMICSIPKMISILSQGMTLLPGTVLSTGTPAGVGLSLGFLKPGDEVVCEIEGIGRLRNIIG